MTELIVRPIDLDSLDLKIGSHNGPSNGDPGDMCLLEAVAWMAGEPWSHRPKCVCPVLSGFGVRLNDALPDDLRQKLKPLIPLMLGTAGDGLTERRRWMAADWAVRTGTPMWMDAAGRADFATELRALAPITDRETFDAIRPRLREISDICWEARRGWLDKVRAAARKAAEEAIAEGKDPVAAAVAVAVAVAVAAVAVAVAAVAAAADAAAAAADAVAVAADAAAAADAVAVAADVAAAAAAAAADAAAVPRYSDRWYQIRAETYKFVKEQVFAQIKDRYTAPESAVHQSAIDLFTRMVQLKV